MSVELDAENYRSILEDLATGFCLVDRERRIQLWSRGAEELTGYLSQEVIGLECAEYQLMHCDGESGVMCDGGCPLSLAMREGRSRSADIYLLHKDGQRIPVRVRSVPVRGSDGSVVGAAGCFEEHAAPLPEEHPLGASEFDAATRLPNRRVLSSRLGGELQTFGESGVPFGILMFAVDGVEHLLEMEGRNGIDAVLYATGQTLFRNVRHDDMAGRWSEERFLVILTACGSAVLRARAEYLQRITRMAAAPWWGERLRATVSVGGTLPLADDTPDLIVLRAEEALQSSLSKGPNGISLAL